jgi:Zn-dependent protease
VPLIGWAKPVPVDMRHLRSPRRDFAIIALAGPVSNLILAIAAAAVGSALFGNDPDAMRSGGLLPTGLLYFVIINVLLAVFNMIPIPPLDGGNVLIGILPMRLAAMVAQLRSWGFLLLYLLLLTGMLNAITRPVRNFILAVLLG